MKKHNDIIITKASGNIENFSEDKLRSSLQRAGADEKQIDDIINEISDKIYQGISTKKIYNWAFRSLKNKSRHVASRYHLKRGIMELGPTGFPFERYVGTLLKAQGYSIKIGEIVKGQCVDHEVDVIAEKGNDHFMIECKYHNRQGMICDVKIPLYIQSRFKDIETQWIKSYLVMKPNFTKAG
ncbi:MAG: ATP cone domain-containing protein [Flavipsychrobacter sp.]|nr:ATP cone domain-containing protein [Flavipsychrobacter sp.]